MKKKLLIIGSSGFFGKSIIDFLEKKKIYDNFFSHIYLHYKSKKIKVSNKLKKKFNIILVKGDLSKIKKLPVSDYIIYTALSNNLSKDRMALKNYINLAKKFHKKSIIIYASSGAVYGDQSNKLKGFIEDSSLDYEKQILNYKKEYAKTKYHNEKNLKKLNKFDIKVIIARCFTFVGKNIPLDNKFVIGNIINNIIKKKTIKIKTKQVVIRSYMHTDDLSDIFLMLLIHQKKSFEIFNVGSDDPLDLHKLVQKLALVFKVNYKFNEIINQSTQDIYYPNIVKLRKKYKYNKKLDSLKSIIKTIKDFKKARTKL